MSGSMWTMRASGTTSRIAFTAAMSAAQTARRSLSRSSRDLPKGAAQPHSPAMKPKKVISLTGVKKCGPGSAAATCSAVALA
jgi:hypothetical protein